MMPILSFLSLALPWFSKAFFSNKNHTGLLGKMEDLVFDMTGNKGSTGFNAILDNPETLLAFQKQALSMQQAYVKHICDDRKNARMRDNHLINRDGKNKRADRMIYIAFIGLFACVGALWICRKALSVELVSIISAIIGVFGSCLKDAYVFEFGSGKLNLMNKQMQKHIEEFAGEETL